MIKWQAETEANTALLSLGAQRREAVIFYSSIASAKDSFVVIATDVHFYPSSDRSRRWDFKKKNKSKDTESVNKNCDSYTLLVFPQIKFCDSDI